MAAILRESLEDVIARRRPQPPEALVADTIKWLAGLPADVRPTALPVQFVRIANALRACGPITGGAWSTSTIC